MKKFIEKYSVYILTVAICLILFRFTPPNIKIEKFDTIISSLLTVVTALVAIVFASLTLLITLIDFNTIKILIKRNLWNLLISYFKLPIVSGFIVIVFSIIMLFKTGSDNILPKNHFVFIASLFFMFLISIMRIGYILIIILKKIGEEKTVEKNKDIEPHNFEHLKSKFF